MSAASDYRQSLADALLSAGPDAPTLCEGWTTRDLAAHLVTREGRPDTGPGLVLPPLAGWTERVRREAAARPFADLVEQFRSGPPRLSPFRLPGVDAGANATEFLVHLEDVRRAQSGYRPEPLPAHRSAALWKLLARRGSVFYRHSPVGVVLVVPDGPRRQVRRGPVSVVLTGRPEELLLHAFGRTGHADVEVTGPPEAVAAFRGTRLGV